MLIPWVNLAVTLTHALQLLNYRSGGVVELCIYIHYINYMIGSTCCVQVAKPCLEMPNSVCKDAASTATLRSTIHESPANTSGEPVLRILAWSGSVRKASTNSGLLRAAADQLPAGTSLEIIDVR